MSKKVVSPVATPSVTCVPRCDTPNAVSSEINADQVLKNFFGRQTTTPIMFGDISTSHELRSKTICITEVDDCPIVIDGPCCSTTPPGALSAGSSSMLLGTVVFSNSNSISFGLSDGTVTASFAGGGGAPLAVSADGSSVSSGTIVFSNSNGVTFGMNGSTITASVSGGGGGGGVDISFDGNTSGTLALISSGTAIFAGGNNITLSQDGQSVTISAANQTVQTQNLFDLSLSGNTSGVLALISSGTAIIAGGNNITLSQNGQSFTISGPNTSSQTVQTQNVVDLSLSGNTSGALALISSGTAILAGGNNITLSQNGQSVTISAANQTVQTQNVVDITLSGNTSGTLALISSGTMTLAGGNNITLSQSGNHITISGANTVAQTNQTIGLYAVSNTTLSTSGTEDARSLSFAGAGIASVGVTNGSVLISVPSDVGDGGNVIAAGTQTANTTGTVSFADSNGISFGMSNNSIVTASYTVPTQTVQTQNLFDLTLSGNTSGTLALVSSGTLTLAGGNNITLSQSGNHITISAFNQTVQTQNLFDLSLSGNTTGTLALISSGTGILAGGNNITLSQDGQSVTISAANQTNQTDGFYAVGNTTQNSSTTLDARTVSFGGRGDITVGFSNGTIQISGSQTNETAGFYAVGNTTENSSTTLDVRTISLGGRGIVTVGYSNGSIDISASQSAQTAGWYAVGNTTENSSTTLDARTLSIGGRGDVTVGYSNGTIEISVTHSIQTNQTEGFYAVGNTTQNSSTTLDARTVSFGGRGDITVGYSNGTIQISGSQSVQTQNVVDVTLDGNTTGTLALISSGTFTLAGGNNITLSQSGNAVTVSAFNQSVQTQNCVDLSIAGNTSGTKTLISSGTAILSGGNNITLSQNGQTIEISAFNQTNQTIGLYMSSNTTSSVSSGTVDARSMTFRGAGVASVGYSNGEVVISAPAAAGDGVNIIAAGTQTANTTGTVRFANSNGISFGMSNSSVVTATMNVTGGFYLLGNTLGVSSSDTYNVKSLSFQGFGLASILDVGGGGIVGISVSTSSLSGDINITISSNGNTYTIEAPQYLIGVSNLGNTSGTTGTFWGSGFSAYQVVFAGGNNITLSQSFDSNSKSLGTITISAANQTVQTQNCVDISIGGNTSGTSTIISSGTAIFAGGNNITLSQSGQNITISAFNQSVQTLGIYASSQTVGASSSSTYDARSLSIVAAGPISAGWTNGSFEISAPNYGTLSFYQNTPFLNMVTGGSAITVTSGSSIFIQPFVLPNYQSIGWIRLLASLNDSAVGTAGTTSANTTFSVERYTTIAMVIYTQGVVASSRSIQYLTSTSVGITGRTIFSMGAGGASAYTMTLQKTYPNTGAVNVNYTTSYAVTSASIVISSNSNTLFTGPQFIDIPFATSLTPGNYWMGIGASTSSNSNSSNISFAGTAAMPISIAAISQSNVSVGLMGQATSASDHQLQPGLGLWTTNASLISTSSIGLNSISQLVSNRIIPFQFIRQA